MMRSLSCRESTSCLLWGYFALQWRRFRRIDADIGRHPILFLLAGLTVLGFISYLLYARYQTAPMLHIMIGSLALGSLSDRKRCDFLRITFPMGLFRIIRLCENLILSLPFMILMLIHGDVIEAGILLLTGLALAFLRSGLMVSISIPTPFGRIPFEYPRGFRYSYLLILLDYFIMFMAVKVGNYNLGLFALLFILGICAAYNAFAEDEYFIRIHALTPAGFLNHKLRNTFLGSMLLSLPVIITLLILDPTRWEAVAGLLLFGMVWSFMILIAKYSAFPHPLPLRKGILLGTALLIPPVLLYTLPAYYFEAKKQIRMYLQ